MLHLDPPSPVIEEEEEENERISLAPDNFEEDDISESINGTIQKPRLSIVGGATLPQAVQLVRQFPRVNTF